jgi:Uma2 family endonuclease
MAIREKVLTYADYLELPETMRRHEIIDGVLTYMTPAPREIHQRISKNLFFPLHRFVQENNLGAIYYAPLDIIVSKDPLRTRQPDLIFISRKRASIIRDQIHGGPDLVVEILSPGNTKSDIQEKLKDYARLTVRECWVVSPEAQTVEVLELVDSKFRRQGLYGLGDTLKSRVLAGLLLPIDPIFAPPFWRPCSSSLDATGRLAGVTRGLKSRVLRELQTNAFRNILCGPPNVSDYSCSRSIPSYGRR